MSRPGGRRRDWALRALPVFFACTIVDVGVLAWSAFAYARDRTCDSHGGPWFIPGLWLVAFAIDRYHG